MLLVGVGSFLYYSRGFARSDNGLAHVKPNPGQTAHPALPEEKEIVKAPQEAEPEEDSLPSVRLSEEPENGDFLLPLPRHAEPAVPEKKPAPRAPSAPVLASGEKESLGKLERVEIVTPALFRLEDLQQPAYAGKLRDRLAAPGAYRVEVLCKDATRGFDRVSSAFSDCKINLMEDSVARPGARSHCTIITTRSSSKTSLRKMPSSC